MLLLTLVRRSSARALAPFASVTFILAGFQVLMVLVAESLLATRKIDLLSGIVPAMVQQSFGPGAMLLATFAGIVTFAYFHPVTVLAVIMAGAHLATEAAGEVEWGLFDLQLARPLARHWMVTRSLIVAFGLMAATVSAMMMATWLSLLAFAPADVAWPEPARIVSLGAHLLLLSWGFSAAAAAAAAFARRRGSALAVVAISAVFLYLLNFLAEIWRPAFRLRWFTPFHYYQGFSVANGTAPILWDLSMLAVPIVAFSALAYWQFARRDL